LPRAIYRDEIVQDLTKNKKPTGLARGGRILIEKVEDSTTTTAENLPATTALGVTKTTADLEVTTTESASPTEEEKIKNDLGQATDGGSLIPEEVSTGSSDQLKETATGISHNLVEEATESSITLVESATESSASLRDEATEISAVLEEEATKSSAVLKEEATESSVKLEEEVTESSAKLEEEASKSSNTLDGIATEISAQLGEEATESSANAGTEAAQSSALLGKEATESSVQLNVEGTDSSIKPGEEASESSVKGNSELFTEIPKDVLSDITQKSELKQVVQEELTGDDDTVAANRNEDLESVATSTSLPDPVFITTPSEQPPETDDRDSASGSGPSATNHVAQNILPSADFAANFRQRTAKELATSAFEEQDNNNVGELKATFNPDSELVENAEGGSAQNFVGTFIAQHRFRFLPDSLQNAAGAAATLEGTNAAAPVGVTENIPVQFSVHNPAAAQAPLTDSLGTGQQESERLALPGNRAEERPLFVTLHGDLRSGGGGAEQQLIDGGHFDSAGQNTPPQPTPSQNTTPHPSPQQFTAPQAGPSQV
jgi:hypothetical protein